MPGREMGGYRERGTGVGRENEWDEEDGRKGEGQEEGGRE
jgi:hypothetical protein